MGGHTAYPMSLLVLAGLAGACGRTTEPVDQGGSFQQVQAGDTLRLRYGESAALGNDGVRILFRGVVSDSRCPINVVCVWAGDAQVRLDAADRTAEWQALELHTNVEPREASFAGYRIHLIEVAPAREDPDTLRPHDYSVRLAISRG